MNKDGICNYHKFGKDHHQWKGNEVKLCALHEYVGKRKPKPGFCEHCNLALPLDLSSNEHKYTRNPNDYEWLCHKCHGKKDKEYRRRLNVC